MIDRNSGFALRTLLLALMLGATLTAQAQEKERVRIQERVEIEPVPPSAGINNAAQITSDGIVAFEGLLQIMFYQAVVQEGTIGNVSVQLKIIAPGGAERTFDYNPADHLCLEDNDGTFDFYSGCYDGYPGASNNYFVARIDVDNVSAGDSIATPPKSPATASWLSKASFRSCFIRPSCRRAPSGMSACS